MIIYIDMDDVICEFSKQFEKDFAKNPKIAFPQSQWGFFSKLLPVTGATDSLAALLSSEVYDPYILTAPSVKNPLCYTEKRIWVEEHLGMAYVERLIISPNKSLLKGSYLIDDNISGKGQEAFEGEVLQFGSSKYPDWSSIRKTLAF